MEPPAIIKLLPSNLFLQSPSENLTADSFIEALILERSSEEKPSPEKYRQALEYLKERGVFQNISGLLVGKPMDETYSEEYKELLISVIDDPLLPVLCNVNIGHAAPRCIIPFGVYASVDANEQVIRFE